jgi:hypothetical protein
MPDRIISIIHEVIMIIIMMMISPSRQNRATIASSNKATIASLPTRTVIRVTENFISWKKRKEVNEATADQHQRCTITPNREIMFTEATQLFKLERQTESAHEMLHALLQVETLKMKFVLRNEQLQIKNIV